MILQKRRQIKLKNLIHIKLKNKQNYLTFMQPLKRNIIKTPKNNKYMMILWILALIDIHTLIVLMFNEYMSPLYIFSGSSFAILKGIIFYLPNRDFFSLLDIIVGVLMLFLLIGSLWNLIWWTIFLYLIYKIVLSFAIIS